MRTAYRMAARAKHRLQMSPMEIAKTNVSVLTDSERAQRVRPYEHAVAHLQFGGFGQNDWRHLADCLNIGEVLAQPPFNLANDHRQKLLDAQAVLGELADQFQRIRSWTARAHQLQALKDGVEIHEIQLRYAGVGELLRAEKRVVDRTRAALANPENFIVVEPLS